MIHVECTYLNPKTFKPSGTLMKQFKDNVEFKKFYLLAKDDDCVILNVMYYDPNDKPLIKNINDIKLLSLKKDNPV